MNIALGQSALLLGLLGAVVGAATLLIGLARQRGHFVARRPELHLARRRGRSHCDGGNAKSVDHA